jgi:hypothetical protein
VPRGKPRIRARRRFAALALLATTLGQGCHGSQPVYELPPGQATAPASTYQAVRQVLVEERYLALKENQGAFKIRVRAHTDEAERKPSYLNVQVGPDGRVRIVPGGPLVKRDGSVRPDLQDEIAKLETVIAERVHASRGPNAASTGAAEPAGQTSPPGNGTLAPLPPFVATAARSSAPGNGPSAPPAAFVAAAPQPTAYAIVIGVEKYSRGLPAPAGSRGDALRFAEMAKTSLGIVPTHVQLALDEEATKASIERTLSWAQASVPAGGRIYFYFSGHGAPDPSAGTAYIVPADGDPQFLEDTAVPLKEVLAKLGRSKAKEVFVFVDACFSGVGERSVIAHGVRPLVRVRDEAPSAQTAIFSASAGNETAGPAPGGGGGLFSTLLLDALGKGDADINGDGQVSLDELKQWVTPRVTNYAKQENREQHPVLTLGPALGSPDAVMLEWGLAPK